VGQFISRDTYLDQKPYNYCEHDPINNLDPSGHDILDWLEDKWKGIAVGAVVGGVVRTGLIIGGLALLPVGAPAILVGGLIVGAGIIGGAIGGAVGSIVNGDAPIKGAIGGGIVGGIGGGIAVKPAVSVLDKLGKFGEFLFPPFKL
jgi:hypothetical protein